MGNLTEKTPRERSFHGKIYANILGAILMFLSPFGWSQETNSVFVVQKNGVAILPFATNALIDSSGTGKEIATAEWVLASVGEVDNKISDLSSIVSGNAGALADIGIRQDSIVTVLATPSISSFNFVTKTTSSTAILTDAEDNKIIFLDYANENYTVPSGVFESGQSIRIQSKGTGTARIVPGAGVNFAPFDGFQLDSITKGITIARISNATSPEEWFPLSGYIKNYTFDPNEGNLFVSSFYGNLAFPSSTGTPPGLNNVSGTISLETSTTFSGTSAMRYSCGSCVTSNFGYFNYPTTGLIVGNSITVTFKYYIVTQGTVLRVRLYDPTTGIVSSNIGGATGVWLDGSVTYTIGEVGGNNRFYLAGDGVFIVDDLKLIKN